MKKNKIELKDGKFLLNGKPFLVYSGEIHYFRIPKDKWPDRLKKAKEPKMVGLIQIDGTDSALAAPILNTNPDDLTEGMKVKVVWAKNIKGHPNDIAGFEPVGGG